MSTLQEIEEILDGGHFELVSFGLAPNPNGFCYEREDDSQPVQEKRLNELLNSLTTDDEILLKERYL